MIHQPEYVKVILEKYIRGTASPVEVVRLKAAWKIYDDEDLTEMITAILPDIEVITDHDLESWEPAVKAIISRSKKASRLKNLRSFKSVLRRAASYLFIIAGVLFLLWLDSRSSKLKYSCGSLPDDSETPTGVYSCKLTLENNCTILIDSTYNGRVAVQGNFEIIKLTNGELVYKKSSSGKTGDAIHRKLNIITTSRGDQYKVILPDGTKVRLNAASSIRFPLDFSETNRTIEIEGEVFFEVARDENIPFYVKVKNAEIRVLGTSFNVNAYSDKVLTTLVSGSLEIKNGTDSVALKPGEEAIIRHQQNQVGRPGSILVAPVDTTEAVSWKKVMRVYTKVSMREFVLDIGRWYNLEMVNLDCVPEVYLSTSLCYDTPVAEVLKIFRKGGLRFNLEGRRVIFCAPGKKVGPVYTTNIE